ncbi:MAG: type II secretion system protein [Candidatus Dojkabacteria bacterium]
MKKIQAFTLIELTIGMAVIAVLITLGIVGIGIVQKNARDIERNNAIASISTMINDYRKQNLSVPTKVNVVFSNGQVSIVGFKNFALKGFLAPTTTNLPTVNSDQSNTKYYYNNVLGSDYQLCVQLESGSVKSAGTSQCPAVSTWN